MKTKKPPYITNISIHKLFGRYNYDIELPIKLNKNSNNIVILYGDNGTGKTTILNILFHLLSSKRSRSHKTFLANTPFSKIIVSFSDNTIIKVTKKENKLTGAFYIHFYRSKVNKISIRALFQVNEEGAVIQELLTPKAVIILKKIEEMGLSVFLLRDDRSLLSDVFDEDIDFEKQYGEEYIYSTRRKRGLENYVASRDLAMSESLKRTKYWLRNRLIQASSRGEEDSRNIYVDIVRNINKQKAETGENYNQVKRDVKKDLLKLDSRSSLFTEFDLISRVNVKKLLDVIKDTKMDKLLLTTQVIRSFIEGQTARLDALEGLKNLLKKFIDLINNFLFNKNINIGVSDGVSITWEDGEPLNPECLSSGEKQLLLIYCNILIASDYSSIFIIDEPELSLNVKWQRKLIDTLLKITSESECKFFLATHSPELFAEYSDLVIKLNPKTDVKIRKR